MVAQAPAPAQPSLSWRLSSSAVMGFVGGLARAGLYAGNKVEVHGLDRFRALVDERADPASRTRGLITVSNHTSVVDDPLLWGTLPLRYGFRPENHRWTLGSYDICFQGKLLSTIFNLGQLLPTHRKKHSAYGGLFQPTMTEAIRLLNDCPIQAPPEDPVITIDPHSFSQSPSHPVTLPSHSQHSISSEEITDPFSSAGLTYTTNGHDSFPRPSAYASRRFSWIHIFPEGFVHQHPMRAMRYFKWGVARLILEADECPDIIPIWHEGTEKIMPEDRGFPRPIPRLGQNIGIWFGENVAGARSAADGNVFADLRRRWQALVEKERNRALSKKRGIFGITWGSGKSETSAEDRDSDSPDLGRPETLNDELKFGHEAVQLRKECTMRVREAVLNVRRQRGGDLPEEDPKAALVETYREESGNSTGAASAGSQGLQQQLHQATQKKQDGS